MKKSAVSAYMKSLFVFLSAWILTGCGVAPLAIDKNASSAEVATDLGLEEGAISALEHCVMADAVAGEKLAIYQPCLYVALADGAALLTFDEAQARYRVMHRLDPSTVRAVGFKSMGRAKQLQIHMNSGFVIADFVSPTRTWGNPSASASSFDFLKSLGIPETDPMQFVFNYQPIRVQARSH